MDGQSLYIDSVMHHFRGKPILNGVYLNCLPGDVIGLLGRNGSGKTTLLKIIFGSLQPKYKHQKINGTIVKAAYKTKAVAYLPQENFLPEHITVKEAVALFCKLYHSEINEISSIKTHNSFLIKELSGGYRRLIEFLVILYSDATFVLLDEPFSQIGPLLISEMQIHIAKVKARKGIIVTDHYYNHILDCATSTVLLHNGANYSINNMNDLQQYGYLPESFEAAVKTTNV